MLHCSGFGPTYTKIGTIQRRLAWPLRKDDTQNREAFQTFEIFRTDILLLWPLPGPYQKVEAHFEFPQHFQLCLVNWYSGFAWLFAFPDLPYNRDLRNKANPRWTKRLWHSRCAPKCPESPGLRGRLRPKELHWGSHETHSLEFL